MHLRPLLRFPSPKTTPLRTTKKTHAGTTADAEDRCARATVNHSSGPQAPRRKKRPACAAVMQIPRGRGRPLPRIPPHVLRKNICARSSNYIIAVPEIFSRARAREELAEVAGWSMRRNADKSRSRGFLFCGAVDEYKACEEGSAIMDGLCANDFVVLWLFGLGKHIVDWCSSMVLFMVLGGNRVHSGRVAFLCIDFIDSIEYSWFMSNCCTIDFQPYFFVIKRNAQFETTNN